MRGCRSVTLSENEKVRQLTLKYGFGVESSLTGEIAIVEEESKTVFTEDLMSSG